MTIQDVAKNLLEITKRINDHSTPEDFMQAGDFVIGQTVANLDIDILSYFDQYPILDDIDSYARHVAIDDSEDEAARIETWNDLVSCIEKFYSQVHDTDSLL
jgi:hypothetical protein